jgi:hypothetical protein
VELSNNALRIKMYLYIPTAAFLDLPLVVTPSGTSLRGSDLLNKTHLTLVLHIIIIQTDCRLPAGSETLWVRVCMRGFQIRRT